MVIGIMRKGYFVFLVAISVVVIDQLTKYFAKRIDSPIEIIKNFFYLKFTTNTGAGFGILKDYTPALIFFSIIILGLVIYYFDKIPDNKYVLASAGLFTGGLIGNLIDRIIYKRVTDFIDFSFWPSFNIADSCVCLGAAGLIIWMWKDDKKDKTIKKPKKNK